MARNITQLSPQEQLVKGTYSSLYPNVHLTIQSSFSELYTVQLRYVPI